MNVGPNPRLRPMAPVDLEGVHALEVAASPDPWSLDLLAGELTGDRADRHWLVAVDQPSTGGSPIIGFGGVLLVVDEAHVMNLVVDPAWRRHGVASRLLASLLLDIGDRGAISSTLEVRSTNRAAISLYERFGFEAAGRRPHYYSDGEDAEIMWCHRIDRTERRDRFRALGRLTGQAAQR